MKDLHWSTPILVVGPLNFFQFLYWFDSLVRRVAIQSEPSLFSGRCNPMWAKSRRRNSSCSAWIAIWGSSKPRYLWELWWCLVESGRAGRGIDLIVLNLLQFGSPCGIGFKEVSFNLRFPLPAKFSDAQRGCVPKQQPGISWNSTSLHTVWPVESTGYHCPGGSYESSDYWAVEHRQLHCFLSVCDPLRGHSSPYLRIFKSKLLGSLRWSSKLPPNTHASRLQWVQQSAGFQRSPCRWML